MGLFKSDIKKALIIPDCHIPYQDERSYNLMLKVAKDVKPDEIVILGDFADFYSINQHGPKDPQLVQLLLYEVDAVNEKMDELDKLFPKASKVFIEGNHEHRLARYIKHKALELFSMFRVEDLFKIKDRGWRFIPYDANQKYNILNSHLIARHCPIGSSSKTTVNRAMASVIHGHTHRVEENQIVALDGKVYRGISNGTLADIKSPVMDYIQNHAQWCHAFSICHVLPNKNFFNQIVHIIDYQCMYNGKLYK
jgi:UDP-2,3-diacylglucosamine pyrophosphatase LpxH